MDSIDYYNRFAKKYYEETVDLSMEEQLQQFMKLIPDGAAVLDLGCGSGRDSLFLVEEGYDVTAVDGAKNMCELAQIHIGKEVLNLTYDELDFDEVFDGIWACASLVHVQTDELASTLLKVLRCLKPGGVIYMSFRYGDFLGFNSDIEFNAYTEETIDAIITSCNEKQSVEYLDIYKTRDLREEYKDNEWINIYLRKQ